MTRKILKIPHCVFSPYFMGKESSITFVSKTTAVRRHLKLRVWFSFFIICLVFCFVFSQESAEYQHSIMSFFNSTHFFIFFSLHFGLVFFGILLASLCGYFFCIFVFFTHFISQKHNQYVFCLKAAFFSGFTNT